MAKKTQYDEKRKKKSIIIYSMFCVSSMIFLISHISQKKKGGNNLSITLTMTGRCLNINKPVNFIKKADKNRLEFESV
jgi:hypothetical protein